MVLIPAGSRKGWLEERQAHSCLTHQPDSGEVGFGEGQLLPRLSRDSHAAANTNVRGLAGVPDAITENSFPPSGIWVLALSCRRQWHTGLQDQLGP